jgi:hypothetical protein
MDSLDARYMAEHTVSGMASGGQKQPRNCAGIRRIDPSYCLARDFTPIIVFPGGPSKVPPNYCSLLVVKVGFWRLQRPAHLAVRSSLANIDLGARRACLQDNLLVSRSFNLSWHIGPGNSLPVCHCNDSDQKADLQQSCNHGRSLTPQEGMPGCSILAENAGCPTLRDFQRVGTSTAGMAGFGDYSIPICWARWLPHPCKERKDGQPQLR